MCTIKDLGNAVEHYRVTGRLVQWDLLKQNCYEGLKWAGTAFMI